MGFIKHMLSMTA